MVELANTMRRKLDGHPEVRQVMSQTDDRNDGNRCDRFVRIEFHVDIYPEKEWESKPTKLELIDKMAGFIHLSSCIEFKLLTAQVG